MNLSIVILAAGKGKRMCSKKPKVLHHLGGKPLLAHVLETARALKPQQILTVVNPATMLEIQSEIGSDACEWVIQDIPQGTGHAVLQALPAVTGEMLLVLFGDVPLFRPETLQVFMDETPQDALGVITYFPSDPTGFGRIVRDAQGQFLKIVEEKDATPEQRAIREVCSGIFYGKKTDWEKLLPQLNAHNHAKEYYLTDVAALANKVHSYALKNPMESFGMNDSFQLAQAERYLQNTLAKKLLEQGAFLSDPSRLDVRGTVKVGQDVRIDVNVIFEGTVVLEDGVSVGANSVLKNVVIGANSSILPFCHLEGVKTADSVTIGPFARIRPGTVLESSAKIGNFVEVKHSNIGAHSKINHLSYVGDTRMGEGVNIGAGTITCNYDGMHKSETIIESGAFIGSNSSLVAPVKVGENATLGAGTVLRKDAPADQLTLTAVPQKVVAGWKRPTAEQAKEE